MKLSTIRFITAIWACLIPAYLGLFTGGPTAPRVILVILACIAGFVLWGSRDDKREW